MLYNNYGGCCDYNSYCNNNNCCCNNGYNYLGNGLGNAAFGFVGEWVNIVVTLTVLQSILGLVCNWNCCGCNN